MAVHAVAGGLGAVAVATERAPTLRAVAVGADLSPSTLWREGSEPSPSDRKSGVEGKWVDGG